MSTLGSNNLILRNCFCCGLSKPQYAFGKKGKDRADSVCKSCNNQRRKQKRNLAENKKTINNKGDFTLKVVLSNDLFSWEKILVDLLIETKCLDAPVGSDQTDIDELLGVKKDPLLIF